MPDTSKILSYVGQTPEERESNGIERKKLCEKLRGMRQRMIDNGMKLHTTDEILDAFHEERAGGEGFKRLWG